MAGGRRATRALAAYLAAEQECGRIQPNADLQAAAALLIGACLQHAFLAHFTDQPTDDEQAATALGAHPDHRPLTDIGPLSRHGDNATRRATAPRVADLGQVLAGTGPSL